MNKYNLTTTHSKPTSPTLYVGLTTYWIKYNFILHQINLHISCPMTSVNHTFVHNNCIKQAFIGMSKYRNTKYKCSYTFTHAVTVSSSSCNRMCCTATRCTWSCACCATTTAWAPGRTCWLWRPRTPSRSSAPSGCTSAAVRWVCAACASGSFWG